MVDLGGGAVAGILGELVVLLVVEAELAVAIAVELLLRVPEGHVEAIARVGVLPLEDGALTCLDPRVVILSWLEIGGPLERSRPLVQWRIVNRSARTNRILLNRSRFLLNSYLLWQLHSVE